jgi:photosystem II oxygen-evolving enhancer protein 2
VTPTPTCTADGDEGGRHYLIKSCVADGKLYLLQLVAGDKRWFKGVDKLCKGALESFVIV